MLPSNALIATDTEAPEARPNARELISAQKRESRPDPSLVLLAGCQTVAPQRATVLPEVTIVIGYYDSDRGCWPWSSSYETINWVAVESSCLGYAMRYY